jgi:hypothetical protein
MPTMPATEEEPMRRLSPVRLAVASVAMALAATAVALAVAGIRRAGTPPDDPDAVPPPTSPDWFRRIVSRRWNPLVVRLGLVGGASSRWASIEHVGRTSGRVYRTPVYPHLVGDRVYIPLPYGVDVNWASNVRSAGHCRLQLRGTTYELDEPAVLTARDRVDLPARLRTMAERRGNRYLRLHVLASRPGPLDDAAAAGEPAAAASVPADAPS